MEKCITADNNAAAVIRNGDLTDQLHAVGRYDIECLDADGNVKWTEVAYNVVTNQGKNGMLDTYFGGSAYTAAWYMSLITAGTATSTSTYASPTVTETTSSVIANRGTMTWSAASSGSKAAATTSFSIIGTATITGNMVVAGGSGVTTVGNTAATGGILFSAANFSGGSKSVSNGDTLNVSYSIAV